MASLNTTGDGDTFLEMRGVSKFFGGTPALNRVDFSCQAGEVHAILGENGAGKSTLMKLLAGSLTPNEGEILLEGKPTRMVSPGFAQSKGIICMFQELSLSPDLTVGENIILGANGAKFGFYKKDRLSNARQLLDFIHGDHISFADRISSLSLAERQQVEIVKAFARDPRLIILDEATSALTATVVKKVFELVRGARDSNTTVLFISHRFHEVEEIADRISVFRSGEHVKTFPAGELSRDEIIHLMIGQPLQHLYPEKIPVLNDETLIDIKAFTIEGCFRDIDLKARRGEIIGIGGLDGQGQQEFMIALFGVIRGLQGTLTINDQDRSIRSPKKAKSRDIGLALSPEDRKTEGLIPDMSIKENMQLAALGRHPFGLLTLGSGIEHEEYMQLIDELELVYSSLGQKMTSLSGGNQQKVALIKWLVLNPSCILLVDPTRGIDVKTKAQIYKILRKLSQGGKAVILLSTDHEELVRLCDRVAVFYNGRIARNLEGSDLTSENVVSASMGLSGEQRAA